MVILLPGRAHEVLPLLNGGGGGGKSFSHFDGGGGGGTTSFRVVFTQ